MQCIYFFVIIGAIIKRFRRLVDRQPGVQKFYTINKNLCLVNWMELSENLSVQLICARSSSRVTFKSLRDFSLIS